MERVIRLGPCVVVLIGAIGLLQAHGIAFWSGKLGPYGIAWSVLLEATALWLWSRPAIGSRALACLASVLLLLGPLYPARVSETRQSRNCADAPVECGSGFQAVKPYSSLNQRLPVASGHS